MELADVTPGPEAGDLVRHQDRRCIDTSG